MSLETTCTIKVPATNKLQQVAQQWQKTEEERRAELEAIEKAELEASMKEAEEQAQFEEPQQIIKDLKINKMILITKTPKKVVGLEGFNIKITKQELI